MQHSKCLLAVTVAVGALLASVGAANATTYIYGTFSGVIDSASGINNAFGLGGGANLAGRPITGSFIFEPAAFEGTSWDGNSLEVYGGPVFGYPVMQPPATVTETINGYSLTSVGVGSSSAFVMQNTPAYYNYGAGTIIDTTGFGVAVSDASNQVGTIVDYAQINSTYTIISDISDISTLGFSGLGDGFDPFGGEIFSQSYVIQFTVTSMSVASVSTDSGSTLVPEPSAAAVLGVGLLGIGMTRRRRQLHTKRDIKPVLPPAKPLSQADLLIAGLGCFLLAFILWCVSVLSRGQIGAGTP